ncbi:hypothetical protein H0W32_02460, partial [Patescibacteria group bacterium]|nr:hypothetical protein [Patescibacteria group bacterium]
MSLIKAVKKTKIIHKGFVAFLTLLVVISSFYSPALWPVKNLKVKTVSAALNKNINYQGKLTTSTGVAVANGTYQMVFKLYTAASGGTAIWTETLSGTNKVQVTSGIFSTMLGSTTPFTGVDFNQTLYLGVNIEADGEMTPRKVLGVVPGAIEAENAGTLGGLNNNQFLRADAANSTSTASTYLTVTQSGSGPIANFIGQSSQNVLTLLSTGNVGIGTTSPIFKLDVAGSLRTTGTLTVDAGGGNSNANISLVGRLAGSASVASIYANQLGGLVYSPAASSQSVAFHDFLVGASSASALRISNTGLIGIGTTSPWKKLSVTGDMVLTGAFYDGSASAGTNGMILQTTGSATQWVATSSLGFASASQIGSGTIGQFPYYAANGTTLSATSSLYLATSGNVGIGTVSPTTKLSIVGDTTVSGNLYLGGNSSIKSISHASTTFPTGWYRVATAAGHGVGTFSFFVQGSNTIQTLVVDVTAGGYGVGNAASIRSNSKYNAGPIRNLRVSTQSGSIYLDLYLTDVQSPLNITMQQYSGLDTWTLATTPTDGTTPG